MKIKIYLIIYLLALLGCIIYAVIIYFTTPDVAIGVETFTQNGVYVLQTSFFQGLENKLFGNIQEVLSAARKAIVFSDVFRTTAILVAILATALMGFTMLIGDQKITIKEFFWDILLIFGSVSLLLYYDPTLSVDPKAPAQPEKYVTLLYNFIASISQFISTMLFSAVDGAMNVKYVDGTQVGYYAPIDVVSSLFTDPVVSYRFKIKLAALITSSVLPLVPIVLIVTLYYLIPCIISTFIAILFAKTTIIFAVQFLPFFILFSSINDVKIKLNKQSKGMNMLSKLIIEGILQPMMFLALTSFVAGVLLYIFVVQNIADVFNFSIMSRPILDWTDDDCGFLDIFCQLMRIIKRAISAVLPKLLEPQGMSIAIFFTGVVQLWVGIVMFKYLFQKVSPIMETLVTAGGSSVAAGIFSQEGGIYSEKNEMNKISNMIYKDNLDVAQDIIKTSVDDKKEKKPDLKPTPPPG